MRKKNAFSISIKLDSIKIKSVSTDKNGDFHIHASCLSKSTICATCGQEIYKSHGQCKESVIQHLPIFDNRVFIHVNWPRFICSTCDDKTSSFHPKWLNRTGEMTVDFENFVLKYLINSTAKDVSEKLSITEDMVEGIVNRQIGLDIDWNTCQPFAIGIDEIALRKGHKQYLTIISDITLSGQTKVLAVIDGRKKDDIKPFLDSIPDHVIKNLQSICIDMSGSYFSALKDRLTEELFAQLVTIDRFHVAKLVGAKVDKQRKLMLAELKREYSKNENVLESLKGTMWPFRRHIKDLSEEEGDKLDALFLVDPQLRELRDLREELYHIFEKKQTLSDAQDQIEKWIKKSKEYKAFEGFISTYRDYEVNILNYFVYRYTSGPVEGLNNKLKVIKRRCFGFRNVVYFAKRIFLDINYKQTLIPAT